MSALFDKAGVTPAVADAAEAWAAALPAHRRHRKLVRARKKAETASGKWAEIYAARVVALTALVGVSVAPAVAVPAVGAAITRRQPKAVEKDKGGELPRQIKGSDLVPFPPAPPWHLRAGKTADDNFSIEFLTDGGGTFGPCGFNLGLHPEAKTTFPTREAAEAVGWRYKTEPMNGTDRKFIGFVTRELNPDNPTEVRRLY